MPASASLGQEGLSVAQCGTLPDDKLNPQRMAGLISCRGGFVDVYSECGHDNQVANPWPDLSLEALLPSALAAFGTGPLLGTHRHTPDYFPCGV